MNKTIGLGMRHPHVTYMFTLSRAVHFVASCALCCELYTEAHFVKMVFISCIGQNISAILSARLSETTLPMDICIYPLLNLKEIHHSRTKVIFKRNA